MLQKGLSQRHTVLIQDGADKADSAQGPGAGKRDPDHPSRSGRLVLDPRQQRPLPAFRFGARQHVSRGLGSRGSRVDSDGTGQIQLSPEGARIRRLPGGRGTGDLRLTALKGDVYGGAPR